MDNTTTLETSTKKANQPLLHVGSELRNKLEDLAVSKGTRWQDLARQILKTAVTGE